MLSLSPPDVLQPRSYFELPPLGPKAHKLSRWVVVGGASLEGLGIGQVGQWGKGMEGREEAVGGLSRSLLRLRRAAHHG